MNIKIILTFMTYLLLASCGGGGVERDQSSVPSNLTQPGLPDQLMISEASSINSTFLLGAQQSPWDMVSIVNRLI